MAFILFEHCIKQKIVTIKHKGVQKRVRGQKFDVIMAIQRQILRESLVFFSFHKFYIHPTAATNQFHKLATLMESHVLVWSTDIR